MQGKIDWPGPGKSVYDDCNTRKHNKNLEKEPMSKSGSTVFGIIFDPGLCLDGIEVGLRSVVENLV